LLAAGQFLVPSSSSELLTVWPISMQLGRPRKRDKLQAAAARSRVTTSTGNMPSGNMPSGNMPSSGNGTSGGVSLVALNPLCSCIGKAADEPSCRSCSGAAQARGAFRLTPVVVVLLLPVHGDAGRAHGEALLLFLLR